jgi:hypothetical protein
VGNLDIFNIVNSGYCTGAPGVNAELDQAITFGNPDFDSRATLDTPADLFDQIKLYAFGNQNRTDDAGYPTQPCTVQAPQQSIGEIPELTDYLHVYQQAP